MIARGPGLWLAVDPGGVTGWVLFRPVVDTTQLANVGLEIADWGEQPNHLRFMDFAMQCTNARLPSERISGIVIEGWWPREGVRTWQPEAVEVIGFCRWLMDGEPGRFYVQKPSEREWSTPEKIRRYRENRDRPNNVGKGGEGHAVQALRHALLWASTRWRPE